MRSKIVMITSRHLFRYTTKALARPVQVYALDLDLLLAD